MSSANKPETLSNADKAAIASLTQRVIAAWAYHDADSFANVFTEDGTMILAGIYKKGRSAIREYMTAAFDGNYKGTQITGKPIDMRPLGSDAAILLSLGGVLEVGESEVSDSAAIRAAWVVVKQNGQWQLAAYQNTSRDKVTVG